MVYACVVEQGLNYKETAAAIGLSATRASSMLHAYLGVKQMEEHSEYGQNARPELFSHFDQAYKQLPVREWLGWDDNSRRYVHKAQLERFYALIVGDEAQGQRPMAAVEVRDVLPGILEHKEAKAKLFSGEVSVAQAGALVPDDAPSPSEIFRGRAGDLLQALEDLPLQYLFSKDGRHDMKKVQELSERLEGILKAYTKDKIGRAA